MPARWIVWWKPAACLFLLVFGLVAGPAVRAQQLSVCCTTPDLASLVQSVGGPAVTTVTFAKGTEDAHFVEATPGLVRSLSRAQLLVIVGLGLEEGWSPVLLQSARNQAVQPGQAGHLDGARAIKPLDIPTGVVDRAQGDVHAGGNPHYLLDPLCGVQVARLICDKLSELRPADRTAFEEGYAAFAVQAAERLVGAQLAAKYKAADIPKLALLYEHGKLAPYLKSQGEEALLGGWLGQMLPYYGTPVVDDHNLWPYFARRFGLKVLAHMEPKPGLSPTTLHLGQVVELMRAQSVPLVLANPYYDTRHAQFLASRTGARVVHAAHQVGSRPGTEDYLSLIDYNVRQVTAALEGR